MGWTRLSDAVTSTNHITMGVKGIDIRSSSA